MADFSQITGGLGGAAQGASAGSAFGPYGAAVGGVIGGVAGFLGGGNDAEELAQDQADYILATARENERRTRLEMQSVLGTAEASVYASGLQMSGSAERYTNAIETQYRRDMSWDRQKAKIDAEMVMAGGQMASDAINRSGVASLLGGIGQAAGTFGPTIMDKLGKSELTEVATQSKRWGT